MAAVTIKIIDALGPSGLQVLEISGSYRNRPGLFKSDISRDYPAYDICDRPLDDTFDSIIAEQVFEHRLWPYRAARNVHRMLRPGSFPITTPARLPVISGPSRASDSVSSRIGLTWGGFECTVAAGRPTHG